MRFPLRGLPLAVLVLIGSAALASASAVRSGAGVIDRAKLFSEKAVESANHDIDEMVRRYKRGLLIETFSEIPEDRKKEYNEKEKTEFFQQWAEKEARSHRVNGVYILICKEPKHFEIEVGNETRKVFPSEDRAGVRDTLKEKLGKEPDKALAEVVKTVESAYRTHIRNEPNAAPAHDSGSGGMWRTILIVGVIVLAVWLIFGLVRGVVGGMGGGSFMGSLFGGLFGAMAGMWLYDSFFGNSTPGAHAGDMGGGDAGGSVGQDTDYSSGGGGDYGGDAGGGGDFGGGDFGGGDW